MREISAQWWGYSVSHRNFQLDVAPPGAADNLVIQLMACEHIAGPVSWLRQHIVVTIHDDPDDPYRIPDYTLTDESVGFRAVGKVLRWRKGYDIGSHHGLP